MSGPAIQSILAMPNPTLTLNIASCRAPKDCLTWVRAEHLQARQWNGFDLNSLSSAFGDLLCRPATSANVEAVLANRHVRNVTEMKNHCIESLLENLKGPIADGGRFLGHRLGSELIIDHMRDTPLPGHYEPSLLFYIDTLPRVHLVVSCVRLSAFWTSQDLETQQSRSLSPIRQLATYAREAGTRYGFVMTDKEVVVVRFMVDINGEYMAEWQAVPRSASGEGTLTVNLAVWALVMMSLHDQHRAVATDVNTRPINLWWENMDANGRRFYRHHLSGRMLPYLHSGAVCLTERD
ncbi:hypothetical protein ACHAPT_007315 [Fusarium lateritium]